MIFLNYSHFPIKSAILPVIEVQNESEENFAEMGFIQAIDVMTALEQVKQILIENSWEFDEKNVIGYGHSHGAYIYSYVGTTDNLVDVESKRKCVEHLDYVEFEVIDEKKVDGVIFRSTNHGLNADFLKLVDYIFSQNNNHVNPNSKKDSYDIVSSNTRIQVDYSDDIPAFEVI